MRYKIEFDFKWPGVTEEQIIEFLNFELGVTNSMETKNPLSFACINSTAKNVKITKQN